MIQLFQLHKTFGDRVLFDGVTWQIGVRERVGLCGPNGAGKTTLLRMLAGLDEPDRGQIVKPNALTVGYLPQDGLVHAGRTLFDEAATAFADLLALRADMHALEDRLADPGVPEAEHEAMLVRYAESQERFRAGDGYSIDLRIATVLRGLGFAQDDFTRDTGVFSGGWQMRIALAKLLLGRPGLLLLDEPTNHLDLEARNWLEEYLAGYPHAVILVSHDRYFLDAVVTRITDLNLRTLTDYAGNYSAYVTERDARLERLREQKRRQDEEVERMRTFIDRFRYQATKAAQVQSRLKMLEKVVPIEVPPERKRVRFTFPTAPKSGRTVLELKGVRKAYGARIVFDGIDVLVERGDRVALIGPNGAGKSTLMRLLSGVEPPDAGTRSEGHQVVMQYFAQDEATRLDPGLTVYETLAAGSPLHMVPAIRTILGGFLFGGDDIYKKAGVLSGGERTRLAVARMLLRPSNTLLLDEPTNHLDMDSKDVLLDALEDFGGTLVLVSHDRYFIDRLATRVIDVGGGRVRHYPGGYEEYRYSLAAQEAERARGEAPAQVRKAPPASEPRAAGRDARPAGREPQAASGGRDPRPPSREPHAARREPDFRSASREPQAARREPDLGSASREPQAASREQRKRLEAEERRRRRAREALEGRIAELEAIIAEREAEMKRVEGTMTAPGFYQDHEAAKPIVDRHQALMWELGDLMHRWEELQQELAAAGAEA